jgi:hypothetical protein
VRGGAWTARIARGVEIGCEAAKLGGRSAVPEGEVVDHPLRLPIPADGVVALRVRWLRALRIFVRDRDSRLDLGDVTLVRAQGWPRGSYPHPGEFTQERVLAQSRPSPVVIPSPTERTLALHVGSPAHAWALVKLDAAEGGERYVVLEPGGDLELELVAEQIDKSTVVRVSDALSHVLAELDVNDRRKLVFEGLPVGKLRVGAEIGPWWKNPLVLAAGEVEIRAGDRARLVLTLAAPPSDPSVVLGGEVVIPPEWGAQSFLLVVELLDPPLGGRETIRRLFPGTMQADGQRPGVWHWRLEGMQPGAYQLGVFQYQYSISCVVPPGGLEDVRLEVPKPCDARVRVVDAASGVEAKVEIVMWNCRRPEGIFGGGCALAEWDEGARRWRLRAPRGEVELHTRGGDYKESSKLVEMREGLNEFVLEVQHQCSVLFKLAQAGHEVRWPEMVEIKLRPKEGGDEQSHWTSSREGVRVPFDKPGAWIVTIPVISGYEPVPPFEVRVDPDHGTEQTVELVPKG